MLLTFLQYFSEFDALIEVFHILEVRENLQLSKYALELISLVLLEHHANAHHRVTAEEDNCLARVITHLFNFYFLFKELDFVPRLHVAHDSRYIY